MKWTRAFPPCIYRLFGDSLFYRVDVFGERLTFGFRVREILGAVTGLGSLSSLMKIWQLLKNYCPSNYLGRQVRLPRGNVRGIFIAGAVFDPRTN